MIPGSLYSLNKAGYFLGVNVALRESPLDSHDMCFQQLGTHSLTDFSREKTAQFMGPKNPRRSTLQWRGEWSPVFRRGVLVIKMTPEMDSP